MRLSPRRFPASAPLMMLVLAAATSLLPSACSDPPPVNISEVKVQPISPQKFGTPITWTAKAAGGKVPLEYRFFISSSATGSQDVVQPYGPSNSFTWTPSSAEVGYYRVIVHVRGKGTKVDFEHHLVSSAFQINP